MHVRNSGYVRRIAYSAVVGALYLAITVLVEPLSYGLFQFRFAEALCLLPYFAPETTLGLFVGCLISNLFSPYGLPDIVVGSAATLLAAFLVGRINVRWLTPLPVVLCNALMVGAVLSLYSEERIPFALAALSVGLGEFVVCVFLGLPLLYALPKVPYFRQLFPKRFEKPKTREVL
ncbi:MAG: QueT transporter family protein [Oscillospiraceae bacterium]|nr:QueT transporter family protein [Oscillospiraceae bacterium]